MSKDAAGSFITLEGGEGVGKSTQIAFLLERLTGLGQRAIGTREPGGSGKAEAIRGVLLSGRAARFGTAAEAILFTAARIDHLKTTIRPALESGTHVVCDRFMDSTRAYQGALGHVPPRLLETLERIAVETTRPDLTLVLDAPSLIGLERARTRRNGQAGPDRFEREERAFHEKLRSAFLAIVAGEPERCVLIDATQDRDAVATAIWAAVRERLPAIALGNGAA